MSCKLNTPSFTLSSSLFQKPSSKSLPSILHDCTYKVNIEIWTCLEAEFKQAKHKGAQYLDLPEQKQTN
jgi:hypothetical protein